MATEVVSLPGAKQARMLMHRHSYLLPLLLLGCLGSGIADTAPAVPPEAAVEDWLLQDAGEGAAQCFSGDPGFAREAALVQRVLGEVDREAGADLAARLEALVAGEVPGRDPRWRELYVATCEARRAARLRGMLAQTPEIVFTRHGNLGGSHYAYTEAQSDAQAERNFIAGAALCRLRMEGIFGQVETLLEDPQGVIRDPDVSYDGGRLLFSWKKSDREDDYHLYEMTLADGALRQITFGPGVADYEGVYLPDGDILFNSTRCVQIVDCWWTEVSNLYRCAPDGAFLRRLSFDQVHTNFPQVLDDGRVVYTRWDYNDRGQIFPQPLFVMNPDGTGQTGCYGNNSWFPTTLIHARGIPGSHKLIAIATGHHSDQSGKLVLVDRCLGTEENEGVRLIAPARETPAARVDAYGQEGEQFGYPYPLSESEYLVTYSPTGHEAPGGWRQTRFSIYWMDVNGRRELLAWHPTLSCNQSLPLAPRPVPPVIPGAVDLAKSTGAYYLQNVYAGPGMARIQRGTVKKLRVVGLQYRAAGIRSNSNGGPGGGAMSSTPVSVGNGAWDVKVVYGEADVHPDGSAYFEAPARTPLYFQALDERGHAVQTMRTWSTLQPGERLSCVGCHEPRPQAPSVERSQATAGEAAPRPLRPFYGPPRGFSFAAEVQPILDRHCIGCHRNRNLQRPGQEPRVTIPDEVLAASAVLLPRAATWRYTTDDPGPEWEQPEFDSSGWATGQAPFGLRGTPSLDIKTEWHTPDIWIRATFPSTRALVGRLLVADICHDEDVEVYLNGHLAGVGRSYVTRYVTIPLRVEAVASIAPGDNTIAVHCHQTVGGQGIDLAILDVGEHTLPAPNEAEGKAFSLLSTVTPEPPAGRAWSDAYLALTNAFVGEDEGALRGHPDEVVNWVSAQSVPTLLPPYSAGAGSSKLMTMLEEGHGGVKLSKEESDKLACWIDLAVPYCGDYTEANIWTEEEVRRYEHFLAKRRMLEDQEHRAQP